MKHISMWRRGAASVVAAGAAAAGLFAVPGTSGSPVDLGVINMTVTLESVPPVVSPPGELVVIKATVASEGLVVGAAGTMTVGLPVGSAYRADLSTIGCTGSGTTVTCPFTAAGGVFEIVSNTPTSAGVHTTTAHLEIDDPIEALAEDESDNDQSVTTDVRDPNPGVAAGLVEGGESISLVVGDGREYRLTVPNSSPGVIVTIEPEDGTTDDEQPRDCGGSPCGDGFHTSFVSHAHFKADNPLDPIVTEKTFGAQDPCLGFGGPCAQIWFAKFEAETEMALMPYCVGAAGGATGLGDAIPDPCVNRKFRRDGAIWFDVRMTSNDPIEIPPFSL